MTERACESGNDRRRTMRKYQRQLLQILYQKTGGPRAGAEIGVAGGQTSEILLREFPMLRLHMVDPWSSYQRGHTYRRSGDTAARLSHRQQEQTMQTALSRTDFAASRRVVHRMESRAAVGRVAPGSLDFVFIDGDHTLDGVRCDLALWVTRLHSRGFLCGHDYRHRRDRRGLWGVSQAVNEFASTHGLAVRTGAGTVWWLEPLSSDNREE